MTIVDLREANSEQQFGGKAVSLGQAIRAGLPVPRGFAIAWDRVHAITGGSDSECATLLAQLDGPAAVRSSAIGEDSVQASFAGQHATLLNVTTPRNLIDAIARVCQSAQTPSALAYRERLGIPGHPRMGVVVQRMIVPDCAGVLFTKNPVTGSDERIVEANFGLGESVVAGLIEPDRIRFNRGGRVLERTIGTKELAIWPAPGGGTEQRPPPRNKVDAPCLDDEQLLALDGLASLCELLVAGAHDIEWAFAGGQLFLLQRRAITR